MNCEIAVPLDRILGYVLDSFTLLAQLGPIQIAL